RRIRELVAEISGRFSVAGVEFVILKGLTHCPDFVADPRLRVQYDIDFYCPPGSLDGAREILLGMGYRPILELDSFPLDHLPTMIRKTGWRWRGNYFDPELPPSVDLHFRFWDQETERLPTPGVEDFWTRRVGQELDPVDRLGYAALHAVRHLLRGSLRLHQVYEIARFLRNRSEDAGYWARWEELHAPETRLLEWIAFRLAGFW